MVLGGSKKVSVGEGGTNTIFNALYKLATLATVSTRVFCSFSVGAGSPVRVDGLGGLIRGIAGASNDRRSTDRGCDKLANAPRVGG